MTNAQLIQSILTGMQELMNRDEIHEDFKDQLKEIDILVWNLVDDTA